MCCLAMSGAFVCVFCDGWVSSMCHEIIWSHLETKHNARELANLDTNQLTLRKDQTFFPDILSSGKDMKMIDLTNEMAFPAS